MPTRTEIVEALQESQDQLFTHFRALTTEELERPGTDSEVPGGAPWRAVDHLSHLTFIERQFQKMIERAIAGDTDPIGFKTKVGTMNREEVLAWVHRQNQAYVEAHIGDSLEEVLADFGAARGQTLELLDQLTDEQLVQPVPGAPWNDGTIGGILITNAPHAERHTAYADEGLRKPE